jgi:hypothetical protein
MDDDLREAERLYAADPSDENRVKLRRAQERARVIVWVAQWLDEGSSESRGTHGVRAVFSTEAEAMRALTTPDPRRSHQYRLRPNDQPWNKRHSDQPRPGDGFILWNGWSSNSISVRPYLIDEYKPVF